jgi:Holliday junction resolvase RusA-like endonuclease
MLSFEIFGKPIPWTAPRRGNGHFYASHSEIGEQVKWQLRSLHRDAPLSERVHLDFTFFQPIPKGTSGIRRRQMLAHMIVPQTAPDTTNMQKFYEDCLKGIVIEDDRLVSDVSARKRYSEQPGVLIRVIPWNLISSMAPEIPTSYSFALTTPWKEPK